MTDCNELKLDWQENGYARTDDGWVARVQRSDILLPQLRWSALVGRADGSDFHTLICGDTCDWTNHAREWRDTQDAARTWCAVYIRYRRTVTVLAMTPRPADSFYDNTSWKRLVRRYADGRRQCNCGDAYENNLGKCENGCSTNCLRARDFIAERIEIERALWGISPHLSATRHVQD